MNKFPKGLSINFINNKTVVRLYNTDICIINNNRITLQSGGWKTMHTKKCMNLVLKDFGFTLFQKKGDWFLGKDNNIIEFKEGMELTV